MDLAQALNTAIQYETRIRDLYRRVAGTCADETGTKVLRILAEEEQQHLDYLASRLKQWTQEGKVTAGGLASAVPDRVVLEEARTRTEGRVRCADPVGEIELLQQALELEQETSDFYRDLVHQLDAEGQALFEPFVEIEDGHVAIVQAEIDSLRGLGYWFDFQEFDLEAG